MRRCAATSPTGRPRISARPEVGKISCISSFRVVVLPAPFGPRKPKTSPGCDLQRQPIERPVRPLAPEPDLIVLGEVVDAESRLSYGHRVNAQAAAWCACRRGPAGVQGVRAARARARARTARGGIAPAMTRPLMKKVGVDFAPSSAPRPASVRTSVSARAYCASKSGMPADLRRRFLHRLGRQRRLVGKEPFLELIGRSLRLRHDHRRGRLARRLVQIPADGARCTPARAGSA